MRKGGTESAIAAPFCEPLSLGVDKLHAAILFARLGPYHFARVKAAAANLKVTAVEYSDIDNVYAWDVITGLDGFDRVKLFHGVSAESRSASEISKRINQVLCELRPAAVALPGWYDRCSLAALLWCVENSVPAVMMSETNAWDDVRKPWREFAKRRIVRLCGAGLVGGESHAAYLAKLGMPADRILTGYDAVDNEHFDEGAAEARKFKAQTRKQHALPEHYFLASARFVEKKNLPTLIRAYATYRQRTEMAQNGIHQGEIWSLILLGDGPMSPMIESLVSELDLEGSVLLPGFKQYQDLPAYYGLASAFIHASSIEQWGLVVNEAMAAGLPVLVSNRCGCATDLVEEGVNGFTFDPENAEELAELLVRISAPDFPRAAYGQASRRIVERTSLEIFGENMKTSCMHAISKGPVKDGFVSRAIARLSIRNPRDSLRESAADPDPSQGGNIDSAGARSPNFFLVGAPKSGTTSMSEYLRGHPNVFFSRVKEPHFFDTDFSARLKIKPRTYWSLFADVVLGVHKAIGEGSTGYLNSKVAVAEILKFNPGARFVVMLRNPIDLVPAWHSEMLFEGVEDVWDFESAWELEASRRKGCDIPSACWEPKKLFYSDWGRLGDHIERLYSQVERNKVKVIIFEDFVASPRATYEEVLRFLGVPSDNRTTFPIINENKELKHPRLQRYVALVANYVRRFRSLSGLNMSLGIGMSRILHLNSKPARRKPVSPRMREHLKDFYRDDIQKLSRLLGRDLSGWVSESEAEPIRRQSCEVA
jgi:glycosyltransferase involved in cell wall biosynthesis